MRGIQGMQIELKCTAYFSFSECKHKMTRDTRIFVTLLIVNESTI